MQYYLLMFCRVLLFVYHTEAGVEQRQGPALHGNQLEHLHREQLLGSRLGPTNPPSPGRASNAPSPPIRAGSGQGR